MDCFGSDGIFEVWFIFCVPSTKWEQLCDRDGKMSVCVCVCVSVASSSVKTTGRILMKFGSYMQGTMAIMPVSLNFMKVKGQGHRSRKTFKNRVKFAQCVASCTS